MPVQQLGEWRGNSRDYQTLLWAGASAVLIIEEASLDWRLAFRLSVVGVWSVLAYVSIGRFDRGSLISESTFELCY